jgi:putative endonuclease
MTNDLRTRIWEHKTGQNKNSFSVKYNLNKLVYFESLATVDEAILREKFLKGKSRRFKEELIEKYNPEYKELLIETLDLFHVKD